MTRSTLSRGLAWAVALTVVAAACTSTKDTTTSTTVTSTSSAAPTSTTVSPPTTLADSRFDTPVPVDPDVTIGALDNGLTYYVRENGRPGGRAQLRLVIDAGSASEDPDQSGGAHFLEHMLFNGTERFPVNELTRVLEGFGARFGPDINAYTSFDETVYELAIPTDDPALLELALDVLREWAARATIAQVDVEEERGVVLEEWRLRDAGVGGRISQVYEDVFLTGTPYEGLAPIGDPDMVRTTDATTLRRFYEEWYRPDLMAVVAVGDFDGDVVLAMIEERFSDLTMPDGARDRPSTELAPFTEQRIAVLADQDQPTASVELYYPGPAVGGDTVAARRDGWARLLAMEMIATRLNDDITRGEIPLFSVAALDFDFTRGLQVPGLAADVASVDILVAVDALVTEVARAQRFGFNESEFDRAVDSWRAAVEQFYAGRASTQDSEYADRYVRHFLDGSTIPSAGDEFDLDTELLDSLTAADAVAALIELTDSSALTSVVIGPDDGTVPVEVAIAAAIDDALAAEITPRIEDAAVGETLLAAPDAVEPSEVNDLPLGVTELVYPNGVRVQYVETDISVNQIVMAAASPGGLSRVADADVPEAALIADIVSRSGAGAFDRVALETFLADKVVFLQPYMDATVEGFFGSAAQEDLESLLQLVHLTVVAPHADDAAAAAVIGEFRPFAESPESIPGLATTIELIEQRWGDEPRYRVVLSEDELDSYEPQAALEVFRDRFGDAGDFVFAFAGDFTESTIRTLADTYLGTLPGTDRDDGWIDYQQDPPPGIVDETVAVGESEQGFVTLFFTSEFVRDARTDVQLELLSLIADTRLRDRIREALSATYSPFLSMGPVDEPDELIETFLQVSGDPERLDEIVTESLATLGALAREGPTAEELATAQEQLALQYELFSNEWWVDQMLFYAARPDESLDDILNGFIFLEETTVTDLRDLAAVAFPLDRYILIRQIPR